MFTITNFVVVAAEFTLLKASKTWMEQSLATSSKRFTHLPRKTSSGGGKVDFSDHRSSIGRDFWVGVTCCHEKTELFVVVDRLVSDLTHVTRT